MEVGIRDRITILTLLMVVFSPALAWLPYLVIAKAKNWFSITLGARVGIFFAALFLAVVIDVFILFVTHSAGR